MSLGTGELIILFLLTPLLMTLFGVLPFWFICKKAGLSPWLSLIALIPGIGILILPFAVAFADWPALRFPRP